jgi:hypothetical protein
MVTPRDVKQVATVSNLQAWIYAVECAFTLMIK